MISWADVSNNLHSAGSRSWGNNVPDLPHLIGMIINFGLGFISIFFFVTAIIAGYKWMTAAGNETAVEEAKDGIKNAAIGIVVIMAAYALTNFVMTQVISTVGG